MCDASNSALGAVLGQRAGVGKPVHVITYASQTMDPTQLNYTTTEKELLAIVFSLDKFRSYLLGSKIVVFSNHATMRFLLKKPNVKPRMIRWMLLLQEFNIEMRDKKGVENSVANHLSRIERESHLSFHQRHPSYTRRDFKAMPSTTYGMILNFRDSTMIKSFAGKLRSRWDGPFVITNVFPYDVVELKDEHTNSIFQVNGHQLKLFHEGLAPIVGDMETISLMEPAPSDDTP
ncbi:Retrovirus-related Pol polyprotein from transposon 17.6, partial [Mucuna pruriens]